MKNRQKFILGAVGLLFVVICCVIYQNQQQKNDDYSYELLRVKASLEQIAQYSENCIEAILSGADDVEKHGYLLQAVSTLDSATSKIALLHNEGRLSRDILELSDHLNGTYPHLSNDTKIYWLNCIKDASEGFLSTLEKNPTISVHDFRIAVHDFSSQLPTYED